MADREAPDAANRQELDVDSIVRGLQDAAELPCIYDGDLDCPDAWPTSRTMWCLPCYARDAV